MDTNIVTVNAEAVVEVTNVEAYTVETCKRFMQAKEAVEYATSVLDNLKAQVENARGLNGSPKKVAVNGRFHNVKGSFVITHVARTQRFASVKAVDDLFAAGVITAEQYATIISETPSEHNLVTFKTKEALTVARRR